MVSRLLLSGVVAVVLASSSFSAEPSKALSFTVKSIEGKPVELKQYQGKVVLIVNVASKCGLTPQYEELEGLYAKYKDQGLVVLGFPCNQFGGQEPGTEEEIQKFCKTNYKVSFDLFSKVDVNGDKACDLYKYLTSVDTKPTGTGKISWNFEKYLLDKEGNVINRFAPRTSPTDASVVSAIESALKK